MNKFFAFALFSAFSIGTQAQSNSVIDSIHVYQDFEGTEDWTFTERIINHYDDESGIYSGNSIFKFDEEQNGFVKKSRTNMVSLDDKKQERVEQKWVEDSQTWEDDKRFIFIYNEQGRKTQIINQFFDGDNWKDQFYRKSSFNDKNLVTEEQHLYYNNAQGKNTVNERVLFSYSETGKLTEKTNQKWDEEREEWVNEKRNVFAYQNNGQLDNSQQELWDKDSKKWKHNYDESYQHAENGQLQEVVTGYLGSFKNNTLEKGKRTNYGYDSEGHLTEKISSYWDYQKKDWYKQSKRWYTYNAAGQMSEEGLLRWDKEGNTLDGFRNVYVFDGKKKQAYLTYNWDVATEDWEVIVDQKFFYNEKGQQDKAVFEQWSDEGELLYKRRFERFWSSQKQTAQANETTDKPALQQSKCSFPNPYTLGSSIYCSELKAEQDYQLTVFDLTGKLLYQQTFRGSDPVSVNGDIAAGVYVFKVSSPKGAVSTHKVVVQ